MVIKVRVDLESTSLSFQKTGDPIEPDVQRRAGIVETRGDMMTIKENDSRWVPCPICGSRSRTKIYADTVLVNFPLYCPKCKKETKIDVVQLWSKAKSQTHDAEPASHRCGEQALFVACYSLD